MTMRTKTEVVCQCGHVGYIKTAENDQPYSQMYIHCTLEGLNSRGLQPGELGDQRGLGELTDCRLVCPKCGADLPG